MDEVFKKFKENVTKRCERFHLLDIGEDSIRYDFFNALSVVKKLEPWEIQLESSFNQQSFVPRNNINSKRKEKPQIDLVVNTTSLKLCAEFGLFRQNSNSKGTINKTNRTVKMMNDMIRVGIDAWHTNRTAYFICVADEKIIGHQLKSKLIGRFPSHYYITTDIIAQQRQTKTADFDLRFLNKFQEINKPIKADLIFDEPITSPKVTLETRILVWEISMATNYS